MKMQQILLKLQPGQGRSDAHTYARTHARTHNQKLEIVATMSRSPQAGSTKIIQVILYTLSETKLYQQQIFLLIQGCFNKLCN